MEVCAQRFWNVPWAEGADGSFGPAHSVVQRVPLVPQNPSQATRTCPATPHHVGEHQRAGWAKEARNTYVKVKSRQSNSTAMVERLGFGGLRAGGGRGLGRSLLRLPAAGLGASGVDPSAQTGSLQVENTPSARLWT